MFKKILLLSGCLVLLIHASIFAQPGTLQGKVFDSESKEPISFANIIVESDGKQIAGTMSDFNGNYTIKPLPAGKYDVKSSYVGYAPKVVTGVIIHDGKITFLNLDMILSVKILDPVVVVDYAVPLIEKDGGQSGGVATKAEIDKMPVRSATSVAVTVGGVFTQDGELGSIRGQRTEGTVMYIDGVRVRGSSSLPKSALEEVTVITGGLPAQYGDVTGGVVSVITRGASRKFGAGVELLSSQLFDPYDYNLLGFNIQGPLIKGDSTKSAYSGTSLFGFFLSGELTSVKDADPSYIGYWKVKDDVLDKLTENPLRPSGTGFGSYNNSEFIRKKDLEHIKAKMNSASQGINLSGKLDVRTTLNTNLTFGGNLNYEQGNVFDRAGSLFNYKNNSYFKGNTWRVFGRFTQRFPNDTSSRSILKNVFYQIQVDYSNTYNVQGDEDHMDNLFDYGYIGKFKTHKIKSYELGSDTVLGYNNVWIHNGFHDTLFSFERSELNPELANYTSQYYSLYPLNSGYYSNYVLVQEGGGLLNGEQPNAVYGLWENVGAQYNGYSVGNYSQIGINASGSADLGKHAVQFGFQYEQRDDRYYAYAPVGLWSLMRQITNAHIEQLDKANPHPVYDADGVFQDTINYDRLYDGASQYFFDYNLRKKLGLPVDGTDWLDIDNYDPSTFSIDMFSADELLNNGNSYVAYQGYDYTGKKLKNKPSIDDFFTKKDEYGKYTREIGAFQPIYMAGYINDKFAFNDLIFNIGLRVDRFDANQKVLKDPYLLYPAKTVGEVTNLGPHPSNMGSDYVVYVNDIENPSAIMGYRNGSTWYNASGTEIADPATIESSSGIAPYLVDPSQKNLNSNAFKDYEPQVNFMPRISFSFPISDEALFFAHYDVLTKRPTEGIQLDLLDYYFIQSRSNNLISNPALKCERTVDYELGFQQMLNKRSSLKISTYYREMRNLVQSYRFSGAYPVSYYSYNNIDFGTVKGFTLAYDLRQSGNVWMKASYTLQFADGTGSDATSSVALIRTGQPNLRTTNPLSFDRRHAFTMVFDFRYGEGKEYNGPIIKKIVTDKEGNKKVKIINLLQNTGANFTFTGGSGIPYSRSSKIVPLGGTDYILQGSINGSRLPWQFKIDARFDKDVKITSKSENGKKGKTTYLNIYIEILNILDSKNVMAVYRATGNPDDDGYLAAAEYQTQINQQLDSQSYRDLYAIAVNNPYNYSLPRRARLGVAINF